MYVPYLLKVKIVVTYNNFAVQIMKGAFLTPFLLLTVRRLKHQVKYQGKNALFFFTGKRQVENCVFFYLSFNDLINSSVEGGSRSCTSFSEAENYKLQMPNILSKNDHIFSILSHDLSKLLHC